MYLVLLDITADEYENFDDQIHLQASRTWCCSAQSTGHSKAVDCDSSVNRLLSDVRYWDRYKAKELQHKLLFN